MEITEAETSETPTLARAGLPEAMEVTHAETTETPTQACSGLPEGAGPIAMDAPAQIDLPDPSQLPVEWLSLDPDQGSTAMDVDHREESSIKEALRVIDSVLNPEESLITNVTENDEPTVILDNDQSESMKPSKSTGEGEKNERKSRARRKSEENGSGRVDAKNKDRSKSKVTRKSKDRNKSRVTQKSKVRSKSETTRKSEEKREKEEIRKREEKREKKEIRKSEEKRENVEIRKSEEKREKEEIRKSEEKREKKEIRKSEERKESEMSRKREESERKSVEARKRAENIDENRSIGVKNRLGAIPRVVLSKLPHGLKPNIMPAGSEDDTNEQDFPVKPGKMKKHKYNPRRHLTMDDYVSAVGGESGPLQVRAVRTLDPPSSANKHGTNTANQGKISQDKGSAVSELLGSGPWGVHEYLQAAEKDERIVQETVSACLRERELRERETIKKQEDEMWELFCSQLENDDAVEIPKYEGLIWSLRKKSDNKQNERVTQVQRLLSPEGIKMRFKEFNRDEQRYTGDALERARRAKRLSEAELNRAFNAVRCELIHPPTDLRPHLVIEEERRGKVQGERRREFRELRRCQGRVGEKKRIERERDEEKKRIERERDEEKKRIERERVEEEKRIERERVEQEKRIERERVEERRISAIGDVMEENMEVDTAQQQREKSPCFDELGRRRRGTKFGGLNLVLPDPELDPAPGKCFVCWGEGHTHNDCPRKQVHWKLRFCFNCGRRNRTLWNCERCKDAHNLRRQNMGLEDERTEAATPAREVLIRKRTRSKSPLLRGTPPFKRSSDTPSYDMALPGSSRVRSAASGQRGTTCMVGATQRRQPPQPTPRSLQQRLGHYQQQQHAPALPPTQPTLPPAQQVQGAATKTSSQLRLEAIVELSRAINMPYTPPEVRAVLMTKLAKLAAEED